MKPSRRCSMGGRLVHVTLQLGDPWWLTVELEAEKLRAVVARSMPVNRAKEEVVGEGHIGKIRSPRDLKSNSDLHKL